MRGDPYWMNARFASTCGCKKCGTEIRKGDRIFYYPNGRHALAGSCAEAAAADFASCMFDERGY